MSSETLDIQFLHDHLDHHFRELREQRQDDLPIFAIEHGLGSEDLEDLKEAVRNHVGSNFHDENAWLPWVIYATEIGYGFSGQVYWKTFREKTPKWRTYGKKQYLKGRFQQFSREYGGVKPSGDWANYNSIIAWPITHAILPEDLRGHLIEILHSGRGMLEGRNWQGLSPASLGEQIRLRARSRSHVSERFTQFSQQEQLVGQIAKALLFSKDEAGQPLIEESALDRIIGGLEEERRILLDEASRSARRGKAGKGGAKRGTPADAVSSLSASLSLRPVGDNNYVPILKLPNLKPLLEVGEDFEEALLRCKATVSGAQRNSFPPRTLIGASTSVRLEEWTLPDDSIVGFDEGPSEVAEAINSHIFDVQKGPWLFKVHKDGSGKNIRSRGVRPGSSYVVVGNESDLTGVDLGTPVTIQSSGVTGRYINLGDSLSKQEEAELRKLSGFEIRGEVDVWPVGTVPFEYDGQVAITWLSSDVPMLGIHSNLAANRYKVVLETGESTSIDVPEEGPAFVKLSGLSIGSHTLAVSAETEHGTSTEKIVAEVRRPTEGRTEDSKIWPLHLQSDPPIASLEELWENEATIEAQGPEGHEIDVSLELHSQDSFEPLASVSENYSLPFTQADWDEFFRLSCLATASLTEQFDEAYKAKVLIDGGIIGSETLSFERRKTLLRWKLFRKGGQRAIHLIDDTGETQDKTEAYRYASETPLKADRRLVRRPDETYDVESSGGLWYVTSGDFSAGRIVPPSTEELSCYQLEINCEPEAVLQAVEVANLWRSAGAPEEESVSLQMEVLECLRELVVRTLCGDEWVTREEEWFANPTDETRSRLQELVDTRRNNKNPVRIALSRKEPCPGRDDLESWIRSNKWIQPQTIDNIGAGKMVNVDNLDGLSRKTMARMAIQTMKDPGSVAGLKILESGIEELVSTPELARTARTIVLAQCVSGDS